MVSRRRRGEAALARRADHNAGGRQCLLVSYIPLGFSSEPRPVLRQNCNAKDHARAHNSQNTSRPHIACLLPPDNDACRSATMLCRALQRICGPAVEAEAHKGLQRGPPQQRQRGLPSLCKIHRIYKTAVDADAVGPRRSTTTRPTRTSSTAASTTRRTRRAA